MNDEQQIAGRLIVNVFTDGSFDYDYNGVDSMKVYIIGIMEMIRTQFKEDIEREIKVVQKSDCTKSYQNNTKVDKLQQFLYDSEKEVTRQDALASILYAKSQLEDRERAIRDSKQPTFRINPLILENL